MKIKDQVTYEEIFETNQYEKFSQVEEKDFVLDLGCSQGYFYFKHYNKNITYVGVDASINCIRDFYENLEEEQEPLVLNSFMGSGLEVKNFNWFFYDEHQKVNSITFPSLLKFLNRKIDFLKFDIEGAEKFILLDHYDLFKNNVKKFAGEIHLEESDGIFYKEDVIKMLEKLVYDPSMQFRLYSVDGIDITESIWENPYFYTEIIINGYVEQL